jgi:pimeloyl-ACP methyl ester carboxylesterase
MNVLQAFRLNFLFFLLIGILMGDLWGDSSGLKHTVRIQTDVSGKLSYLESGAGRETYLLLPGIGETKEGYLELVGILSERGRVFSLDLPGQGGSGRDFPEYSALGVAKVTIGFLEEIQKSKNIGKVTLVGSSLSAASAVYIGAERPDLVNRIVLSGPFVRDHDMSLGIKILIWSGFRGFWGPGFWGQYYRDLHITVKPEDLDTHSEYLEKNLREENRLEILREYLFSSKEGCSEKLNQIKIPVDIVMGGKDPDFSDPKGEAEWIAKMTGGRIYIFEDSGHYPHREEPRRFAEILFQ